MTQAEQRIARYALVMIGVVIVVAGLFSLVFRGPGDRAALLLSAAVAIVVQLAAASLGRIAGRGNLMARMGTGALLRLITLVAYALIVAVVLKLPIVPALISLATFFFVSSLLEPLLIKS